MNALTKATEFVCPLCKAQLDSLKANSYYCEHCHRHYPVRLGIPDFRIYDDAEFHWSNEQENIGILSKKFDKLDFVELVEFYLSLYDMTAAKRKRALEFYAKDIVNRGSIRLTYLKQAVRLQNLKKGQYLEIGCGMGGTLHALSPIFEKVIGVDTDFCHLILAKKLLEEKKKNNVTLVCAFGEALPFLPNSCNLVHATGVIEHVKNQKDVYIETYKILHSKGCFCFDAPNKFSLWIESHTRIWGIGWYTALFPKLLSKRMKARIKYIKLFTLFELQKELQKVYGSNYRIESFEHKTKTYQQNHIKSFVSKILFLLVKIPIVSKIITFFCPTFEIIAFKE